MKRPKKLIPGDRIGVIAPAGPIGEKDLQPGIRLLESEGFEVQLGRHLFHSKDYLAGEDEDRLRDLHEMFLDPGVAAVFCARGGYGTPRLLERMDYAMIRKHPKIFVGYSDVTALLLAIYRKSSLVTFHGPVVRELGTGNWSNWDSLVGLLRGDGMELRFPEGTSLRKGRAAGPLVGGNLSLISHLLGTPFLPSLDGCILFIEELGEPLYRLDRMITHLRLSGQRQRLAGFVAGRFKECGVKERIDRLLEERLEALRIPMATGLPVGHGGGNVTLPIGVLAELDTERMVITLQEPCVDT